LYQHFRPEFLQLYHLSLSSDAFSSFASVAESSSCEAAVTAAHTVLTQEAIPRTALDLDEVPEEKLRDNELFDLSEFLHSHGINMRYLPRVAASCRSAHVRRFLEEERVVRALKHYIREEWLQATSEENAIVIAEKIIEELHSGARWDQAQLRNKPDWSWEPRLRAAINMVEDSGTVKLVAKVKNLRPPTFVPLPQQETALLSRRQFLCEAGRDDASVVLQMIALYAIWSADPNCPQDSLVKGHGLVTELLSKHRNKRNALHTAASWYYIAATSARRLRFSRRICRLNALLSKKA